MKTILTNSVTVGEILLDDKHFHAKLKYIKTEFLHPNFTEVALELLENNFPSYNKETFSNYWSSRNAITDGENPDSYIIRHLRAFFRTEAKPIFNVR